MLQTCYSINKDETVVVLQMADPEKDGLKQHEIDPSFNETPDFK